MNHFSFCMDPLQVEPIEVDECKKFYVRRDNPAWPAYSIIVDPNGVVQKITCIWSLGAHQVYEKGPNSDVLIGYRRGRFGCQELPAETRDAVAYVEARKKQGISSDSEFRNSESELVRRLDVKDEVVVELFGVETQDEFDAAYEAFDLREISPGPKFTGKGVSITEFFARRKEN